MCVYFAVGKRFFLCTCPLYLLNFHSITRTLTHSHAHPLSFIFAAPAFLYLLFHQQLGKGPSSLAFQTVEAVECDVLVYPELGMDALTVRGERERG